MAMMKGNVTRKGSVTSWKRWHFVTVILFFSVAIYMYHINSTSTPTNDSAAASGSDNDSTNASHPSQAKGFLPDTCHQFIVDDFPSLTSQISHGKNASLGNEGGEWSACTHIKNYVRNAHFLWYRATFNHYQYFRPDIKY